MKGDVVERDLTTLQIGKKVYKATTGSNFEVFYGELLKRNLSNLPDGLFVEVKYPNKGVRGDNEIFRLRYILGWGDKEILLDYDFWENPDGWDHALNHDVYMWLAGNLLRGTIGCIDCNLIDEADGDHQRIDVMVNRGTMAKMERQVLRLLRKSIKPLEDYRAEIDKRTKRIFGQF